MQKQVSEEPADSNVKKLSESRINVKMAEAMSKMFNREKLRAFVTEICTATCARMIAEAQANFEVQVRDRIEKNLNQVTRTVDKQIRRSSLPTATPILQ